MEPRRSATSRENVCEAGGGRSFARVPRGWAVRPRRAAGAVPGESRRPWWARRRPGGASARRAGDAGCAPGRWRLRSSRQDASPPLRCGGWSPARPCSSSSQERPAHPGGRHSQTRNGQRVAPVKEPSGRPRPRCPRRRARPQSPPGTRLSRMSSSDESRERARACERI